MDIDDEQSIYAQLRAMREEFLRAAKAREGQIPTDRKTKSQLIKMHQEMKERDTEVQSNMAKIRRMKQNAPESPDCSVPSAYPPSTASLGELTPIQIKDLKIETHHRGNYLLVKAATRPNRMRALIAIVEDEMGEGTWMQLCQQPDEATQPAFSIISEGDVFIIKEPWFKVIGDEEYALQVDHVSDLLRIDTCHKLWPKQWKSSLLKQSRSVDDWKQEGNLAMKRKEHWKAIRR
jgi:hypothetical protein